MLLFTFQNVVDIGSGETVLINSFTYEKLYLDESPSQVHTNSVSPNWC